MLIDSLSSVLPRPRPGKWGLCDFYPFRYLSGQLRWERCLEGGKWTTKSNSPKGIHPAWKSWTQTFSFGKIINNWKWRVAIGDAEEPCKGPVLSSQSLIKSLNFEHIINLIFAEAFWRWYDATHPELQHTVDRKKRTGWQNPPYLDSFKPLRRNL